MDYIFQHCFEQNYRNAHDKEFIGTASSEQLAIVVRELNDEFLDAAKNVIEEDVAEPIRRFRLYSDLLEKGLTDIHLEIQATHLQIALCTGSLLEGMLQLFLLAYKHDFLKARWRQWENLDIDALLNSIKQHLSCLVNNGTINGTQKKNLLDLIKGDLKIRKDGIAIERIMLDELIGICRNQKIFTESSHEQNSPKENPEEVYKQMECIRDCRNNVHVFTNRTIPTCETVLNNVRNYCLIANDIIIRVQGLMGD